MDINLLIHTPSFDWKDIAISRANALETLIVLQTTIRDEEDYNCTIYKSSELDNLIFEWGCFHDFWDIDFDFDTINAAWISKYVQPMTGGIIDWVLYRSQASNFLGVTDLDAEFQNDANAYIGLDEKTQRLVYDANSYNAFKISLIPSPEPVNWSKIRREIELGNILPNIFERLDSIIKTDSKGKPIHGQQVHIHFKNGNALNIDGTWKHNYKKEEIPTEAKEYLLKWGFTLPK